MNKQKEENLRPLADFLGSGSVAQKRYVTEKFNFQDSKKVIHAVTITPLPEVKVVSIKTASGKNTGVLNVRNFAGA